jgi:hypothetical protein
MKKIFLFAAMALMTSTMAQAKGEFANTTMIDQIDVDALTVTIKGRVAESWATVEDALTTYAEQPAEDAIAAWSLDLLSTFEGGAIDFDVEGATVLKKDFSANIIFVSNGTFVASEDGAVLYVKDGTKQEQIATLTNGLLKLENNDAMKALLGQDIVIPMTIQILYNPNPVKKEVQNVEGADFNVVLKASLPATVEATVSSVGAAGFSCPYALDFTSLKASGLTAFIGVGFENGAIQLIAVDKAPAKTALYLKGQGTFEIPTLAKDESYFVNIFKPAVEQINVEPTVTVGGETYKNYSFNKSQATGDPTFYPITTTKSVGPNKMYLSMPDWAEAGKTSASTGDASVKISDAKVASFSSDKDLDFTGVSGLKAFIAAGFSNNSIVLSQVKKVAAGTGLYLKADAAGTYTIPAATGAVPYFVDAFVGLPAGGTVHPTETIDGVEYTNLNFALSQSTGEPTFFPLTADKTYSAGKMYLQLPSSLIPTAARGIGFTFVDAEATGISEVAESVKAQNNEGIFNLNGQRVSTPRKGLYIINGRKMLMK